MMYLLKNVIHLLDDYFIYKGHLEKSYEIRLETFKFSINLFNFFNFMIEKKYISRTIIKSLVNLIKI